MLDTFRESYWLADELDIYNGPGDSEQAKWTCFERMREIVEDDPFALPYRESCKVEPESFKTYSSNADRLRRVALARLMDGQKLTRRQWHLIKEVFEYRCAYCGVYTKLHKDHVVAIVNGGSDGWANIVPACAPCNGSKNAKGLDVWIATRPDPTAVRNRYIAGVARRDVLLGAQDEM